MRYFSAIDYQRQLIVASLDDFSPNSAMPNYRGGQYGADSEIWREAVIEFLCINVKSGFLEATHRPEICAGCDIRILEDMLRNGDRAMNAEPMILWNILYFNGTKDLIEVVGKFNLRSWDCANQNIVHEDFMDFIRRAYEIA